ncbi:MAG TPA: acetylxylan esterase, partial [Candidatus Alectryocaccobium stercorigallinarum]|nr:acetylxylan esterase [Candidatus Alectryocaccobium stercorigallinarum]
MGKLNAKKWLIIIVAILLVCFIGQYVIVTDSGKVRVEDTQWVTDDGTSLHGKMYIPDSADAQNPAPAVVTCHGFNNTVGDMENNNIELSRRGYVVISVDMAGHGSSSTANGLMTNDDAVDGALDNNVGLDYEGDALVIDGGVYSALQYLGSLPYVDVESIGLIGHSGGAMAISAGAWRALANHETDSNVIIPNSIIVSCDGASRDYNEFSVNIGTITPEFDEFGPGHWNVEKPTQATTTAKMKQF